MIDLYTAVSIITLLVIAITAADILTNRIVPARIKYKSLVVCILIAGATAGEYIGVATNGAAASLIPLHIAAKLVEFCFAPAIGAAVAMTYCVVKKPKIAVAIVAAHALFQCFAATFDGVFSINSHNIYQREELYFIYVAVFVFFTFYAFFHVVKSGKEYQTGIDSVIVLTIIMLITGIGIQFIFSDVRVDYLCIAITNNVLFSRYYKIVLQVDAVTTLLNRRCYESHIGDMETRSVIIFFDINKFKNVNDTYGHFVGDICLKRVADILRTVYGRYGTCYRIGGDEFCVILDSNIDDVEALNTKFNSAVEEMHSDDDRMPNVAWGYAYYDIETTHIQNVIEEADSMLYRNKVNAN